MSARISLMYKNSGGCSPDFICQKCGYYTARKNRNNTEERCTLHQQVTGEEAPWNASYMACKSFIQKGKQNIGRERMDSYDYSNTPEARLRQEKIQRRIRNIALQAPCFDCAMQEPFIDEKGVIRCRKAGMCRKVVHYAKAEYQNADPDFDDITYARCGHCGQFLYRPGETTKCPCCGYEIMWDGEPI